MPAEDPKLQAHESLADAAAVARRDEALVRGLLNGDQAAVEKLIDLYDSLIRFVVFQAFKSRCRQDPEFLDARSSEVWTGFIESIRRAGTHPRGTLKAYLTQIARNKCSDFLRQDARNQAAASGAKHAESQNEPNAASNETPLETLLAFEQIETVRECIRKLPEDDRKLLQELDLISKAQWLLAARRLNMAESTLRSRWQRVSEQLRQCVEKNLPQK